MAGSDDNVLKLLIEFGLNDAQAQQALNRINELKDSTADAGKEMENVSEKADEEGKQLEATGEHAGNSKLKHMALHHAMSELNKISPGLGTSMMFLSRGYMQAGEAAKGAAAGTKEFQLALEGAMATILPLLAIMLTIQTISTYWDIYKEKVKAAAEAQTEAMKQIEEATEKALKAQQELNEATHPTSSLLKQDEERLKKQEESLEKQVKLMREGAKTPEEKARVEEYYEKQKASLQIQTASWMEAQLKHFNEVQDQLVEKSGKQYRAGDMSGYNKTVQEMTDNAAKVKGLGEARDSIYDEYGTQDPNGRGTRSQDTSFRATAQGQARGDWSQLEGAFDVLKSGGHLEARQEQMIQEILKGATGQMAKHDKILDTFKTLFGNQQSMDKAFDNLVVQLRNGAFKNPQ